MSAALVESVRAAVALDGRTNMAAWTAEYDARRALDLPAILAALTEAEALRAQVAVAQAREVALREALRACARMGSANGSTTLVRRHVNTVLSAPTDTAALRKMLLEAFKSGEGMAGDSSMYHNMSAAECEAAAIGCVDRVLGGS